MKARQHFRPYSLKAHEKQEQPPRQFLRRHLQFSERCGIAFHIGKFFIIDAFKNFIAYSKRRITGNTNNRDTALTLRRADSSNSVRHKITLFKMVLNKNKREQKCPLSLKIIIYQFCRKVRQGFLR